MYLLSIGDLISKGIAGVILLLDCIIYSLISSAYKIFMAVASARLLSSDAYSTIANNLYAIVGVVMLFVLAYAIIRSIMDPDQATKGELSGGKLVKSVAIAVIGLAITPTIFEYLYQAQGLFVEHDVIGKIFFRNFDSNELDLNSAGINTSADDTCQDQDTQTAKTNCYVKSIGGAVAATSIWTAFFHAAEGYEATEIKIKASDFYVQAAGYAVAGLLTAAGVIGVMAAANAWNPVGWLLAGVAVVCGIAGAISSSNSGNQVNELTGGEEFSLADAYAFSSSGNGFSIFTGFLSKYQDDGEIEYLWGVSTIVGLFALYSFVSFTIDMGVRAAKLAYYQIIAPIPIILQVLPKFKENFKKYTQSLISTFMEIFVRISVVYIVVYIICHLTDLFSSTAQLWGNQNLNFAERALAMALLIMGLIIFAQTAPKIISESLGLGGNAFGEFKGLREKLGKGGFFSAMSLGGSAFRGAQNGFNQENPDGSNPSFRQRLARSVSGMAASTARNAWNQYAPLKGHKPIDDFNGAREGIRQSVNDANAARVAREERRDAARKAREEHDKAAAELEKFERAREKANTSGVGSLTDEERDALGNVFDGSGNLDTDKLEAREKELSDKVTDAGTMVRKYRITGRVQTIIENDIDAYGRPMYDTKREEEKVKFADSMKKLNGDLRDIAYDDDKSMASALKQRYEQVKAEKVSEYRDGWDDESYHKEIRDRQASISGLSEADARSRLSSRRASMESRVATLASDRAAAQAALTAAEAGTDENAKRIARENFARIDSIHGAAASDLALFDAEMSYDAGTGSFGADEAQVKAKLKSLVTADVDAEVKLDQESLARAQQAHAQAVQDAKDAMEAAADAYVFAESQKDGSKVANKVSSWMTEHIQYINANHDTEFTTYEGEKKTVAEMVAGLVGETSARKGSYSAAAAREDSSYTSQNEFEYGPEGSKKKVYYRRGKKADGSYTDSYGYYSTPVAPSENGVPDAAPVFDSDAAFFGSATGIKAKTAASKAGKFGKDAANYTNIQELQPRAQRKMQQQEKKGGNK